MSLGYRFGWVKTAFVSMGALLLGCAARGGNDAQSSSSDLDSVQLPAEWPNHGSQDCRNHTNSDPAIFKFKYDENTFILRENKCFNFEANFIYVLFGHDKVLLQDTGSIPQGFSQSQFAQGFPLRSTVEGIITDWLAAHPNADGSPRTRDTIELLVTHSHSHGDHVSGDFMFKDGSGNPFPHTQIAGLRPNQVASFWNIPNWPNGEASLDLGGRQLDVIPIPGHEPSHIAVYDHNAHLLLSGDSLYPGHLFVQDWTQYRASMQKMDTWVHAKDASGNPLRPITYVLGNHIEKKPSTGEASFYPYPSWIQDPERKLELFDTDVTKLSQQVQALGAEDPGREVFMDDFAIDAE
jgi:glyoxylase-like metal-dependent hydrolase (beta-lactamase superfamily II)